MIPFRIKFHPLECVAEAEVIRNVAHAEGFPRAQRAEHVHPVAVCGGGPSLDAHLEELRSWPGDIWAINHTADYLLERGIDCTLFAVDPLITSSTAAKRLLATCCNPGLFTGLVQCFAVMESEEGGVPGGTTAAGRTPGLALRLGYPGAVYFGCDSSFDEADHVDRHEALPDMLLIDAAGAVFKTYPELMMQAECLADVFREFGEVFANKSGGLVSAMVLDPDWEVVGVSANLRNHLIEFNGDEGLYNEPYRRSA